MTTIYCDGGCSGNGTNHQRAYGSYAFSGGNVVTKQFGDRSNNEAEYMALIMALEACETNGIMEPVIKSDSQLMVNQVTGKWRVNDRSLKMLCNIARDRMSRVNGRLIWVGRDTIVAVLGH